MMDILRDFAQSSRNTRLSWREIPRSGPRGVSQRIRLCGNLQSMQRTAFDEPVAAHAVDLANAMYGQMLRFLVQAFGRANPIASEQSTLIDAAIELMQCMAPVAEALTKRPASLSQPNVNAGMTFAMLRNLAPPIEQLSEWVVVAARVRELAAATSALSKDLPEINGLDVRLLQLATRLDIDKQKHRGNENLTSSGDVAPSSLDPAAESGVEHEVEVAQGKDVTIKFHSKRCIPSRFCVLWQPQVYRANVEGAWLDADADSVEATVAVAHSCPSGAMQYERHDGVAIESSPSVNFISIRENGSLAVRAEIMLDGQPIGYRATFCRCGASKNKPFCDSSHNAIGFKASSEPQAVDTHELAVRNGPLELLPQRQQTFARTRQSRNLLRNGPNNKAHNRRFTLSLRRIAKQTIL
jgi:CDGSH-type Zn-finger protein/uncharacterized Fe-S cluster protein YjdI